MPDDVQPAVRCHPLAELRPSEAEMAAWLYQIVGGEGEDQQQDGGTPVDDEKLVRQAKQKMEGKCAEDTTRSDSGERRKRTTAGARRSHHKETHSLIEKKRRCKINERMKTLQQLVPGCDKCNQASTLEQTIQYMKSLQQQIQAMSFARSMKPASAAANPVVPPPAVTGVLVSGNARPAVVLGPSPAMVPLAHHHSPAIILPAARMLYPIVAPLHDRRAPSAACRRKSHI